MLTYMMAGEVSEIDIRNWHRSRKAIRGLNGLEAITRKGYILWGKGLMRLQ